MAWGTPTSRGTATDTASPTTLAVASVSVSVGSLILVAGGLSLDTATVTVSDSAGNTYTVIQADNTAASPDMTGFLAWAPCTAALVTGTVTVAWGGGTATSALAEVFEATGGLVASINDSAVTATGVNTSSTTSPTLTSGTPGFAGDLLFAVDITRGTATTWTEDAGHSWTTARAKTLSVTGSDMALGASYQVNAGLLTTTWAPSTENAQHAKIIAGFKVLIAAADYVASQTLEAVAITATMTAGRDFVTAQTLEAVSLSTSVEFGSAYDPGTQSFLKAREWPYRAVRSPRGGRRR